MFYIELARLLMEDREREIEDGLRHRRWLKLARMKDEPRRQARAICTDQRPVSTGAVSR